MSKQIKGTSFASKKEKKAAGSRTVVHLPNSDAQNDAVPSFGAVLRKYRNKNEMSQPELAEIMGISRNTITNWENDKCRPEVDSIRTLCSMLGIPLYELFGLSNDSMPSPHENVILSQYRQLSRVGQKVIDPGCDGWRHCHLLYRRRRRHQAADEPPAVFTEQSSPLR